MLGNLGPKICFVFISTALSIAVAISSGCSQPALPEPHQPPDLSRFATPANLDECFHALEEGLPQYELDEMRNGSKDDMIRYHHGLGMWMRNNWGLWRGEGPLYEYMAELGLVHPDDMSGLILDTFWLHLNQQPLDVEKKVDYYREYWRVNANPENLYCPEDSATIDQIVVFTRPHPDGSSRAIHIYLCCKEEALWAYEVDSGWYRAEGQLLEKSQEVLAEIREQRELCRDYTGVP